VEIPCGEKSAMSETSNFSITFFYVFLKVASKKRKKSRFLDFQKNVKNVFSNYALGIVVLGGSGPLPSFYAHQFSYSSSVIHKQSKQSK